MSESHQPSIKTFFQAPKRPRHVIEPNSDSDNGEDRPLSKSTRLDSLKQQEDESKDSDDLYEPIGVGNRVEHTSSNDAQNLNPTPINGSSSTTGTSRSNPRVFPWKSEYKELFNWLDYDPIKGEARCSYRACKMYIILSLFNQSLILVFGNEMKWKLVNLKNIKIQLDTKIKDGNQDKPHYLT